MRVIVDARCLQDPLYSGRGVGSHTLSLLRGARRAVAEPLELVGVVDEQLPALGPAAREVFDRIETRRSPPPGPAVFFQPSPMTHDPSVWASMLAQPRILPAAVLYDFIPHDEPDRYLASPALERAYTTALAAAKSYAIYFPISRSTADRARDLLGLPESALHVTGVALRAPFARRAAGPAGSRGPCGHFLVAGGGDPRKNVECALRAHARLRDLDKACVVFGGYPPEFERRLRALHAEAGGAPERLVFRAGLTDEELADLYQGAIAAVVPSRTEGFSIPVIEAMATGTVALASSCAAHREIVPDPSALFDADDPDAAAALMRRALEDAAWASRLRDAQGRRALDFTEEVVGARLWPALERAAAALERRRIAPPRKPRVAIITPYPPDRSGVAQYSEQTVAALSKLAVVDVFTDAPAPPPSPFVRRFAPITELPYVAPGWDRTLSVVGNSSFHVRMLEMLERHGGPCLVHDNRLAELYHWWRGPVGFAAQASRWLGRPVSIAEAEAWVREPGTLPSIFFHDVVRQAAPLLVHSRGIQARVREEYGVDAIALPFCVYRTFAEDELSDAARRAAAERLGLPRDRCSIVTLGMVAHTKGPLQCVEATRELLDQGVPADLYFVGPDEFFREPILARAAGLRITERVHLTGSWVSDRQYRDFVIAADLAIQLRSHGFGGLSGALQDCIAAGLPTVANRDLADAGDSPSYVMRVPDALSPGPIAASLAEAWKRGAHRTRLSEERRRYVEEHGFDVYARRLLAALELA